MSISIAGQDYNARSAVEITFTPEESSLTVQVPIINDAEFEPFPDPESFFGNLMISPLSSDIAQVSVPQATVNIEDDDREWVSKDRKVLSLTDIIG